MYEVETIVTEKNVCMNTFNYKAGDDGAKIIVCVIGAMYHTDFATNIWVFISVYID